MHAVTRAEHDHPEETFPSPPSPSEWARIKTLLSTETAGGVLLLGATALALVAANSPLADRYFALAGRYFGGTVAGLDLRLSLAHWAADGLLAIFFFLVGLELKREFVAGDLRNPRAAVVPVAGAVGGVVVPALIYLVLTRAAGPEASTGWAIPAATDIAFALAVLAVVGRHLPPALRTFLLTMAVVDDLIAITIIALFYTSDPKPLYLGLAVVPLLAYGLLAQRGQRHFRERPWLAWALLLPLGVVVWALFLESGVHATIAGVLLAFTVPVKDENGDTANGLAEILEHRYRPLSAGFAVPIFAFLAAGVALGGWSGFTSAVSHPVAIGIMVALVMGKAVGITAATFLVTRLRNLDLDPSLGWLDVMGVALLAGIGFTVSLLISDLSFADNAALTDVGKIGVLSGSVLAALAAGLVLMWRSRVARSRH